ncbi:MAG: glucose-1-phosphate thymidylyltransferase [bacterium]|nr:MAG: glucose-1-phosphate thymidylyltransferase [bacterium]
MKALVLAAGSGRNMAPFSETRPKPMIHVAGRPILYRTLSMLKESGFSEVNLVIGPHADKIENYFGTGSFMDMTINYNIQKKSSGIGNGILAAQKRFNPGEHFLLVYGDIVTEENVISGILQTFAASKGPTAGICLVPETASLGNVYLDNAMNITRIVEKPGRKDMGNYVLAGIYVLPYEFFKILGGCGGDMKKALAVLVKKERRIKGSIMEKGWVDVAYPWDILAANKMVMDTWQTASIHQSISVRDAKIKGPVHIEEGVEIRSGAVILGPTFIGRGSYIGNNVLIRKYSSLGPDSVVGFGVELKNCVLFGKTRVGRLSFVGDSVIGQEVDIGAGTMTINCNIDNSDIKVMINNKSVNTKINKLGAFLGDECILGSGHNIKAGSVIQPQTTIPHHHTFPKSGR